jgi:peroxiredoxin/predicted 2-oxoglutarate/Fe(II)-dependent dioxygenase YbiX
MSAPTEPTRSYASLAPGDPAPWFHQRSTSNPKYAFDTAAGRYVVLCFFISASDAVSRTAIESVLTNRAQFDDERFCFFGVSIDPRDETQQRVRESLPGIRFFWDADGTVSRLYGAIPKDAKAGETNFPARRFWVVLDPTLRVLRVVPFAADGNNADTLFSYLRQLPPPDRFAGIEVQAPILFLPNVFEAEFCRHLIRVHEADGGAESGFMRDVDGKTVEIHDYQRKRRRDHIIEDPEVIRQCQVRVLRRIRPEILKVYSFNATRMERYIVGCYLAEDGGHFRAHRDNTTKGTAHRRFAVSINLNAEFEGGEVSFPEYGPRSFKPPTGGAVIFPCALLHAVSPVTHGRRYAFLPFLYDEEAAKIREANSQFLAEGGGLYKANQPGSKAERSKLQ